MIRWAGLAPWEFEFPFPGSLTSTFPVALDPTSYPLGGVRGFRRFERNVTKFAPHKGLKLIA